MIRAVQNRLPPQKKRRFKCLCAKFPPRVAILLIEFSEIFPQKRILKAPHFEGVRTLSLSSRGDLLATGDASGVIRIFDFEIGEQINEYRSPFRYVSQCVIFQDGQAILVSGLQRDSSKLHMLDITTGHQLREFGDKVTSFAIGSNDETLITGGYSILQVHNLTSGEILHEMAHDGVGCLAINEENTVLISASSRKSVRRWDIKTGTLLEEFEAHSGYVNAVLVLNDRLLTCGGDGNVHQWPGSSFRAEYGYVSAMVCSQNWIATAGRSGIIKIWKYDGTKIHEFKGHSGGIYALLLTSSEGFLISGSLDNHIRVFSTEEIPRT